MLTDGEREGKGGLTVKSKWRLSGGEDKEGVKGQVTFYFRPFPAGMCNRSENTDIF